MLWKIREKQFKNILKINLIIGKKQNLVMRKKKAVRGRNIIIANGEKKMNLNKKNGIILACKKY